MSPLVGSGVLEATGGKAPGTSAATKGLGEGGRSSSKRRRTGVGSPRAGLRGQISL